MQEIKSTGDLLEIGSSVSIDINRIEDRLSESLKLKLTENSSARILDYKLTDGTGIGFLLELNDGTKNWFFSHEITSAKGDAIVKFKKPQSINNQSQQNLYFGDKISYVANPINFINWLISVTSDIF